VGVALRGGRTLWTALTPRAYSRRRDTGWWPAALCPVPGSRWLGGAGGCGGSAVGRVDLLEAADVVARTELENLFGTNGVDKWQALALECGLALEKVRV